MRYNKPLESVKDVKVFESSEGNVWKYVFHFENAVAEAVLYRYNSFEERTVLCVSVQSGCDVGCKFCGTGNQFIRDLDEREIFEQVRYIFADKQIDHTKCKKLQIMFMSMGEPFLNYGNFIQAVWEFRYHYPDAKLLVSTIAPKTNFSEYKQFIEESKNNYNIGLQFSIHNSLEEKRNALIPYENKMSLPELRDYGIEWWKETGRKPYCNYCVNGKNNTKEDFERLRVLFPPNVFCFTFSVICSPNENAKDAGFKNLQDIENFRQLFINAGYDTRVFDPAGQDDIGGGCGQLWYVQQYIKENINTGMTKTGGKPRPKAPKGPPPKASGGSKFIEGYNKGYNDGHSGKSYRY